MKIRVVISGRSYDQTAAVPDELELSDNATLDDALGELANHLGDANQLPASCLVALAGRHLGTLANHTPAELREGDELLLFAPVAGG